MSITINNLDINEDLVDFPLPVVFTSAQSNFWAHVKSDGADVRFIGADDTTELYFEFEQWNYTGNEMTAWVRVPKIANGSITDYVLIYYGYASANFDGFYNSNNVWNDNYHAVWHLNDTSGNYNDATANNNHLTTVSVATRDGEAKIGSFCPVFNGINNYLSAPHSASLNFPGDLTIEDWINTNDPTKEQDIVSKNDLGRGKGWNHELYNAHNVHIQNGEASPDMEYTATNPIASASLWYHIVWVWNEGGVDKARAYVNGIEQTTTGTMADWTDQEVPLYIGLSYVLGRYPFDGRIDEVRLSNVSRSSQWIKACYEYERDSSKLTLGIEEEGFWPTELFMDPPLVTKTLDQVGTTFPVNVTIKTVRSLQGFDINMTWNDELIALFDVEVESTLDNIWGSGNWFLAYNQSGPGYCEVAAASTANSFTSQEARPLVVLTFEVKHASSGNTTIHFALAKLSNSRGHSIPATLTDGIYSFSLPSSKLYIDPSLVEKVPGDIGMDFNVNITVASIVDLFGFDINVTWDNNLITLSSVDYTTTLDAIWGEGQYSVMISTSGNGWYKLVAVSLSHDFNTTEASPLAKLVFHVQGFYNWDAETKIHFITAKLSDSAAKPISTDLTDGTYRMKAEKPTLQIEPQGQVCRKYGERFNVTLLLKEAAQVEDLKFEIGFNTTMFGYIDGSASWGVLGTGTIVVNETTGTLEGSVASTTPVNGDHWVLNFSFISVLHHVWKDESQVVGWRNNQTGTVWFQWVNLSYPNHADISYMKGALDQINVTELHCTFSPIQGDVDNDGEVDIFDLRTVAYYYDVKEGDPLWTDASKYNLNGDKSIDVQDLVIVAVNFGFKYDC